MREPARRPPIVEPSSFLLITIESKEECDREKLGMQPFPFGD